MSNLATEQILVDIIKSEMSLANNNVFVATQNKQISNDTSLYVTVRLVDAPIYANNRKTVKNGDINADVEQAVYVKENMQIDVFSASNLAITRRYEILLALNSVYSIQKQEEEEFKIFQVPVNFVNSSGAEGGSEIYRYTATISCFRTYRKSTNITEITGDYYNDFDTRVDDKDTISTDTGLIEFNIT